MSTTFCCRWCRDELAAHGLDHATEQRVIAVWADDGHRDGGCLPPPPEPPGDTMYDRADYLNPPGDWTRVALLLALIAATFAIVGWLL